MENRKLIYNRLETLYKDKNTWIDPYDSEEYDNRYIRKLMKILLYFIPNELYKLNLVKHHIWPENLELIGKCYLKLGDISKSEQIYQDLLELSEKKYFWGLPINWKSGEYIFPKGSMMSTTTAEIALFFLELKKYSSIVTNDVLKYIAYNLLNCLNRVYEDENNLILGYTPYDNYRINNSNLLVAAALHEIGELLSDENLIRASIKITNSCINGISDNGGIPYYMNGNIYDSYHQIFSLKALYFLKDETFEFKKTFCKAISFLKYNLMDDEGNVYLTPNKDVIDMQGAAEALIFFQLINEKNLVNKISKQIDSNLELNKRYIQRYWKTKFILPVKSRAIFTRQGELRLLLGKINNIVQKYNSK